MCVTGYALTDRLLCKSIDSGCHFFTHYLALDLLMENGECKGVMAFNISEGTFHRFISSHTLIASGGYGQIYLNSTSPYSNTGNWSLDLDPVSLIKVSDVLALSQMCNFNFKSINRRLRHIPREFSRFLFQFIQCCERDNIQHNVAFT